jgi:heat shock protein HslJ
VGRIPRIMLIVVAVLGVVGCMTMVALGALVAGGVLMLVPVVSSQSPISEPTPIIAVQAEFPMDPRDLVGTEWKLLSLNGRQPVGGSEITIVFTEDEISGQTGCRRYRGAYWATGDGIKFLELGMTEPECGGPEALILQEGEYTTSLEWATNYRLSDGKLEIITARGETLIYGPLQEGAPSAPGVTISPTRGPSGTLVEVVASGFPANTEVSVGLGPANSQFAEVAKGSTDSEGFHSVQVPVEGEAGMDWVFAVAAEGQPAIVSPDLFHITD